MSHDADVIVAGAGPAGSIAAFELAVRGVSVLILEKSTFPRYKVCGAGLTHKILKEIPFDVSPVFETAIRSIQFSHGLKDVFTRTSAQPFIYCSMRDKFDAYLLEKAVEAGARVEFGEQVTFVEQDSQGVSLKTKRQSYRSQLVIGADGASGVVARSAGLRDNIQSGLAWEAEIATDPESLQRFSETVFLDWGAFPGGYAWMFPKADHFSIGVGGPARLSKEMMPYYHLFLRYLSANMKVMETQSLKSWPIPVRVAKSRFHNGRILVAGDAGGLTDPMTGEGIFYAVGSGKEAARSCYNYLAGNSGAIAAYTDKVNDEYMTELLQAERIKSIFNTFPAKIHGWVRESDRAWGAFGKILRGERNYAHVRSGFGRWRFLWNLATLITGTVYKIRENRFIKRGFPVKQTSEDE